MTEFVLRKAEFNPDHVFTCGQTFRFQKENGIWCGVARGNLLEAEADGSIVRLRISGQELAAETWRQYLDLDRPYAELFPEADPVLRRAMQSAPGLRVLNQEPVETLISFILSANNNIPRISGTVKALCEEAGTPFSVGGEVFYAFPDAAALAGMTETSLRTLGAGYRAPYILASAERAAGGDLDGVADMDTEDALKYLQTFPGVGPKVAACVALFAFGKREAFPVDTWMRRIVRNLYGFEGSPQAVQAFAEERFGSSAGIAQQYLFHYARRYLPAGS